MTIFTPGIHKLAPGLISLNIHNTTSSTAAVTGHFYGNDKINVYHVDPMDRYGIVWGMVTPPDALIRKFIGLSVEGRDKVVRIGDFDTVEMPPPRLQVTREEFDDLVRWAMIQGYKKP